MTIKTASQKVWIKDVELGDRLGVTRAHVWSMARKDPEFPKPVKLSPGTTRFYLPDVEMMEQKKLAQS